MDSRCIVAALAFSAPTFAVADGGHGSICCGEGATGGYCCGDFGSPCLQCGNYTYGVTCTQANGHQYNCPCGEGPGTCHFPLPSDFKHVDIRFVPTQVQLGSGEGVSQSDCPPEQFDHYRLLADKQQKLHLVAMDASGKVAPCVQGIWKMEDFKGFTTSNLGVFSSIPDQHTYCLHLDGTARLETNGHSGLDNPCTKDNNIEAGSPWTFTQAGLSTSTTHLCMGEKMNGRPPVVEQGQFPQGQPVGGCGAGWSTKAFNSGYEEALSSAAESKTCDDCTDMYGGFACRKPDGTCTVTPGQDVCEGTLVNGEWCAKPRGSGSICCGTGTKSGEHCCHNFGWGNCHCGNSDFGVTCTQADGMLHNCPCYLDACNDAKADNATNIVV